MIFNKHKIALMAFDTLTLIVAALLLMPAWTQPAYAYVDPSVMTYTIQAVAGVAVALSAVAGVALRRTRKFLFKIFKIDENANKVVDPDVRRIRSNDRVTHKMLNTAAHKAALESKKGKPAPRLKWRNRIWRALVVCFFVVFTFLFVAPCELVIGNSTDLTYGITYVAPVLAVATVAVTVVASLVISCIPGRVFDVIMAIIAALGICLWAQGLFLNGGLPSANGAVIYWNTYMDKNIISAVVWVAIFLAFIVLSLTKVKGTRTANVLFAAALILVQGIGLASLVISPTSTADVTSTAASTSESENAEASSDAAVSIDSSKITLTDKGLYDLSDKNNVVVFVLDCEDTAEWEEVMQEYPDMLSELTGFTYFKNVTGASYPTKNGIPYLLTHEWPSHNETWTEYCNTRYGRSTLMSDIASLGYSIGIYSDNIDGDGLTMLYNVNGINVSYDGQLINQKEEEPTITKEETFNPQGALQILVQTSLYRDLPWLAKPLFRYYTDNLNTSMIDTTIIEQAAQSTDSSIDPYANIEYTTNDAQYYSTLTSYKLRVNADTSGTAGSFRFIHLYGSHSPFTMDENAQDCSADPYIDEWHDTVTKSQQIRGSIHIVNEYINQMKQLGVYDSSTIIITSDHAHLVYGTEPLSETECPVLVIKPAETAEQAAQPYTTSTMPVSQTDIAATIISAMGGDYSKYGQTAFEITDTNRVRYFNWVSITGLSWWGVREYEIDGDALNWSNWKLTGYYWDCEQYFKCGEDSGKPLSSITWAMPGISNPILCGSEEAKAAGSSS